MDKNDIKFYKNIEKLLLIHDKEYFSNLDAKVEQIGKELLNIYCDTKPKIKTSNKIDKNREIIYRGVTLDANKYIRFLKTNRYSFYRFGFHGFGNYFTYDKETALDYANISGSGLVTATLDKNFVSIESSSLRNMFKALVYQLKQEPRKYKKNVINFIESNCLNNPYFLTSLATAYGFDAITNKYNSCAKSGPKDIMCIINPKKVTYFENNK